VKKLAVKSKGSKKKPEKLQGGNKTMLEQIPELSSTDEMNKVVPLLKAFTTRHQSSTLKNIESGIWINSLLASEEQ
jgi:hypothetical protein